MMEMAARVGTFAQRSSLVQQMMTTQKRLYATQTQLATEQKSQNYAGISLDSFRLVSIETERTTVQRFTQGNQIAQVRLDTMSASVEAVNKRLHDLRSEIDLLGGTDIQQPLDRDDMKALDDIQDFAFGALQDMTFYLNARADGRYVFSGGRTNFQAVDLPYSSLSQFQADYDGVDVIYPDSRDTHVPNIKLTDDEHGGLTFPAANTIEAAGPGIFDDVKEGSIIKMSGSDQYYTVTDPPVAGPPSQLLVKPDPQGAGIAGNATLETVSYYNGDDLEFQHRVNERRSLQLGLNAKDSAFEKAIRAMGMLSQGSLYNFVDEGTSGDVTLGLENPGTHGGTLSGNAGSFSNIPVGAEITVEGATDNGGKTFVVQSVSADGSTITFAENPDYDTVTVAEVVAVDADASTPNTIAYMPDRIEKAMTLINDAIDHDPNNVNEKPSDIDEVSRLIGFNQVTLDRAIDEARNYDAFLETRQVDIEKVNVIDAATRLQDDARALEVSFQSFARISQLSLNNFI